MFKSLGPVSHAKCPSTATNVCARSSLTDFVDLPERREMFAGHSLTPQRHVTHNQQVCNAATLQFIKGIDEPSVPDVRLTRSKDGSSGTATFVFDTPSVFESSEELGDITGLFMIDDEGEFSTVDVQAKFVNGKPDRIEAKYIMRSAFEWDRFMRYMERYAEQQGLGFQKVCAVAETLQLRERLLTVSCKSADFVYKVMMQSADISSIQLHLLHKLVS